MGETPAKKKLFNEGDASGLNDAPSTPEPRRGTVRAETTPGESPITAPPNKKRADDESMIMVVSRAWVNEDPYPIELIRGLPAELVRKGQDREMNDLIKMEVFRWIREETVPEGSDILDCGWAMRLKITG